MIQDGPPTADQESSFPLAQFLGMATTLVEPGQATTSATLGPRHLNPHGVTHGGVIFTLVDTGMGHATTSLLEEGQHCASVEIQIRFLHPVRSGVVEAQTTVLRRGGRIVHLESRVHDSDGALVATASGTFAVLGP